MADVDFFLKIDGVEGESQDRKGEMQVESFFWGETNTGSASAGSGLGGGKVSMQDFHFVKKFDKASPVLMQLCALGTSTPKAVLTGRKAGGGQKDYFIWTFTDILISSFQTSASSIFPTDQISINFAKIEMDYKEQKANGELGGSIKRGYDVTKNKAT